MIVKEIIYLFIYLYDLSYFHSPKLILISLFIFFKGIISLSNQIITKYIIFILKHYPLLTFIILIKKYISKKYNLSFYRFRKYYNKNV